jgi:hypothetical protein
MPRAAAVPADEHRGEHDRRDRATDECLQLVEAPVDLGVATDSAPPSILSATTSSFGGRPMSVDA